MCQGVYTCAFLYTFFHLFGRQICKIEGNRKSSLWNLLIHTFLINGTKRDQLFLKVSWDESQPSPYVPPALENNCLVKECSWPVDFFCRLWKIGATNLELKWIVAWYEMKWLGPSFAAPIKIMDQSCNVLWSSFVSCSSLCYTENRINRGILSQIYNMDLQF